MEKEEIQDILDHEVYKKHLFGVVRFKGLLGEFFEMGAFEDESKIDSTPFVELKTVGDVEKILSKINNPQ